ncbi:MAG: hypothetical protein LBD57_05380, partial [Endomicrobium sp.]|nr:hypothetical protein [Endomicrobium sp.]
MNLHLDKKNFAEILRLINDETKINLDILEKDYYVCLCLEELSKKQEELKAYFKGGTAIYKKLDELARIVPKDSLLSSKNAVNIEDFHRKQYTLPIKLNPIV